MRKSTTFRKTIIAFGSIFSNMKIVRTGDNGEEQTIKVPIAQGSKEKWLQRIDSDPTLENQTAISLPRMSYTLTSVAYDVSRKISTGSKIICAAPDGTTSFVMSPAPYNLDFTLSIMTKSQEDAFDLVEQIISKFNPELTLTINNVEEVNIQTQVPIVLQSVSISDDSDGDFQTRRTIVWDISFTAKCLFYPRVEKGFAVGYVDASDDGVFVTASDGVDVFVKDMIDKPAGMCETAMRVIGYDEYDKIITPFNPDEVVK